MFQVNKDPLWCKISQLYKVPVCARQYISMLKCLLGSLFAESQCSTVFPNNEGAFTPENSELWPPSAPWTLLSPHVSHSERWPELHLWEMMAYLVFHACVWSSDTASTLNSAWSRCWKVSKGAQHQRTEIRSVSLGVTYFVLSVNPAKYVYIQYCEIYITSIVW